MNKRFIPYGKQHIDEEDIQSVVEILKSDFLTTGPKIEEFEKKFANYVGSKYAVVVSNGTAALHIACLAAGIDEGDEVITTALTFAASSNSVLYCGGIPVFADIDPNTYNIDSEDIKKKITNKTKAIIPVHYTGQPCDMDSIMNIAKEHNLIVIEDAAHALGSEYKGRKIGSIADMTTFSFHPVKHITTGEGGMVTTDDEEMYEKLKLFRTHGITRESEFMEKGDVEPWYYEQLELGYNYRITDFQCALGLSQLKKLDGFIERRREIVDIYNAEFNSLSGLITPFQAPFSNSSYHLYVIQLELDKLKIGRREVFEILRDRGICVNVHYIPVYYFPYYEKLGYRKGICPNAEAFYEKIITLPLYPGLTDEDIDYVIKNVKEVLEGNLK